MLGVQVGTLRTPLGVGVALDRKPKEKLPRLKLKADIEDMQWEQWKSLQANNPELTPYLCGEFPLILKKMTGNDKLTFLSQNIPMQKSFQKLGVDSIIGGENSSPFWNEYSKAIFNFLSLPTPTDSLDSGWNWLAG
jgi:hypothetical protein